MIGARLHRLVKDESGVSIVEFALISPLLMVLLMGTFDLAYTMYTNELLNGAIQKAARDSTIEGAATSKVKIDASVTEAVRAVIPGVTPSFDRKSYASFSKVSRPEDYTDANANNTCDAGEPFEDANGNGSWDVDPGQAGFGGARDAVLYTVTIQYPRIFPIAALIPGINKQNTLKASTVLRNQPYSLQQSGTTPKLGKCS